VGVHEVQREMVTPHDLVGVAAERTWQTRSGRLRGINCLDGAFNRDLIVLQFCKNSANGLRQGTLTGDFLTKTCLLKQLQQSSRLSRFCCKSMGLLSVTVTVSPRLLRFITWWEYCRNQGKDITRIWLTGTCSRHERYRVKFNHPFIHSLSLNTQI
jgi:hypothetical protein